MNAPRHDYLPVIPDALASEEFLGIVIEDGREVGRRERIDACSTFARALAEAEGWAARRNRSGPGTAYALVLRRELGPWELAG
jgi:hypothetical protein